MLLHLLLDPYRGKICCHLSSISQDYQACLIKHTGLSTFFFYLLEILLLSLCLSHIGSCPMDHFEACGDYCFNNDDCSDEKICCPDETCGEHCVLPRFQLGMYILRKDCKFHIHVESDKY